MNQFLSLTVFIFIGLSLAAQPVIQSSDFYPSIGETFTIHEANYMNPGSSGNNVTWDLSGLNSNSTISLNILPADPNFPNSTHQFEFVGQVDNHLKLTPQAFEIVGEVTPFENIDYSDPIKIFEFPMTIGDQFTDIFSGVFDQSGTSIQRSGSIDVEVDGYGTLITPQGTFTDVLRIHSIRTVNDDLGGMTITSTIDMYQWIQAGTHTELANVRTLTMPGTQITQALYLGGTVGLNDESLDHSLTIYPNPSQDIVSLAYDLKIDKVEIFDMNGRSVPANFNISNNSIDISSLNAGIYYVSVFSNNNKSLQKLIKR